MKKMLRKPLPNRLQYWRDRILGFNGFFDLNKQKLQTIKLDSAEQIKRAKEMTSREAFEFLRTCSSIHPQAISLAVRKLELVQTEMLLASRPLQDVSIPLQVRLQELKHGGEA